MVYALFMALVDVRRGLVQASPAASVILLIIAWVLLHLVQDMTTQLSLSF
jgi:hypothetical protein